MQEWARLATDADVYHIVPVHDLKNHLDSRLCWCKPTIKTEGSTLIIHNSLDGREFFAHESEVIGH